jgi:hypothetical protein
MEAMAKRMGHDVVGHHPFVPGESKTAQAFGATRCFEDKDLMSELCALSPQLDSQRSQADAPQ